MWSVPMRDLLIRTGQALYGPQWQRPLAADLGVSDRTVRRWYAGDPIPEGVKTDLLAAVRKRGAVLDELAKVLAR